MHWKRVVLPSLALAALAGGAPGASAARKSAAVPPRVVAFSPAAAHAGDLLLVDVEQSGPRPPRVWIGRRRVPQRHVRVADASPAPGVRRVWARIPAKTPPGEHVVRIANRAGTAVAAKTVRVAACEEGAAPFDCGDVPDDGVELTVTGAGGFLHLVHVAASPAPKAGGDPGTTVLTFCRDGGDPFRCVGVYLPLAPSAIHVGNVSATELDYYDELGNSWTKAPGGTLRVVEETPTRVALCIDAVLGVVGEPGEGRPASLRMTGHLVFSR